MTNLTELFCDVDDFYKNSMNQQRTLISNKQRNRKFKMSVSEVSTLLILFHLSGYRTFKHFYTEYVPFFLSKHFPNRVSYNRFVELEHSVTIFLSSYLQSKLVDSKGISFTDSTKLSVCDNHRINRHKTLKDSAKRGKTSMGWFYGFKLHLIVDDLGQIVSFYVSSGNVDDRQGLRAMVNMNEVKGKVFADRGYISNSLKEELNNQGVDLIYRPRSNMKKTDKLSDFDSAVLYKRNIIETIFGQLKNMCQIEHTRHRSFSGFCVNLLSGLLAYVWKPQKPSLNLRSGAVLSGNHINNHLISMIID